MIRPPLAASLGLTCIMLCGLWSRAAFATDDDTDGWDTTDTPPDCVDDDATIHPAAEEDGIDAVDNDCDLSPSVRRIYVTAFEGTGDFNTVRVSTPVVGELRLNPISTGAATATLKGALLHASGQLYVNVSVLELNSVSCEVDLAWSGGSASASLTSTGVQSLHFSTVPPGSALTTATLKCTGSSGSYGRFDWMTFQNGPYVWAPLMDVSFDFDGMGVPGGGRQALVRLSDDYSTAPEGSPWGGIVMKGSDVGGFAWTNYPTPEADTHPNTVWVTANGGYDEWNDGSELAVMEAKAEWRGDESGGTANRRDPREFDIYTLNGADPLVVPTEYGGLWTTHDIVGTSLAPQSWERAPASVNGNLSAFKHRDDCPNSGASALYVTTAGGSWWDGEVSW